MTTAVLTEQELRTVSLIRVRESRTNPRQHFAPGELKDLTESIREKGVLVPLLVRPAAMVGISDLEIVAGARRYRAAKAAGLEAIPVLIRTLDDKQAAEIQVIENLQRADVHPLEEAAGYRRLIDRHGYTEVALAAKVGKDEAYVRRRLQLERLSEPGQKAFLASDITLAHALLIARLQPTDQGTALQRARGNRWDGPATAAELRTWIQEHINLDLSKAPFDVASPRLLPKAGACAICPKRAGTQPALFEDIAKGDTCTDPGCYQAKVSAHLVQLRGALKGQKLATVDIRSDYAYDAKVPSPNHWKRATKGSCKDVKRGIVVQGDDRGKSFDVCTNEKCRTHFKTVNSAGGVSRPKPTKADRDRQAKQAREAELAKARATALGTVLEARVGDLLERVVANLRHFEKVPGPIMLALAEDLHSGAMGLHAPGSRGSRYEDQVGAFLLTELEGQWKKDWQGRKPADHKAARFFIALHVFLAFDLPGLDAKLAVAVAAQVKRQEVASVDPKTVACPNCRAKPGGPCKRPSGHPIFGGGFHAGREQAAVAARKGDRK